MIISAREERLLTKDTTLDPGEPQVTLRGGYPGASTKATRTVNPGERIGSLEVIAAPGHGKIVEPPVAAMRTAIARGA